MLKFLKALAILLGTVIGAGIFGLPYVVGKSGIVPGFFYFLVFGGAVLLIHLFFGEVLLRTKKECRLPGLAQKYLGGRGKVLVMISVALGIAGALLAYLILGGEFMQILLAQFGLSQVQLTLIFGIILSYFIFRGTRLVASVELLTNTIFFLVMIVILYICLPKFELGNLSLLDTSNLFLPFGVILFSLIGWSAVPEIVYFLRLKQDLKKMKKVIVLATVMVISFYFVFILAVLGVAGKNVSQDTLSSLAPFLGPQIMFWGALAALITLADSYLVLGLHLKHTFVCDFKMSPNLASLITCALPIFLFLAGFRSFIATLGVVGTVVGLIEGITIILIFKQAKKGGDRRPEYSLKVPVWLLYFLIALLFFGGLSQFLL